MFSVAAAACHLTSQVGVPVSPPYVPDNVGGNNFGCNDWPSACQPHFMLHAMLTTWMVTRPLASVAALITPETFHNLVRGPSVHRVTLVIYIDEQRTTLGGTCAQPRRVKCA